jgi:hypothetical protein
MRNEKANAVISKGSNEFPAIHHRQMNSNPPSPATVADDNQVRPGEPKPVELNDRQDRLTNEAAPSEYSSWFRQLLLPLVNRM